MGNIFWGIYQFFQDKKLILFIGLGILLAFSAWRISTIKFEQDIFKVLPYDKDLVYYEEILKNAGIQDKITITFEDEVGDIKKIKSVVDDFIIEFGTCVDSNLVEELVFEFDQELTSKVPSIIFENLPQYITDEDYLYLDSLISDTNRVNELLKSNLSILTSPAGMVMKKYVVKDPLGLGMRALKRLNALNLDDDFEMKEGRIYHKEKHAALIYVVPSLLAQKGENKELLSQKIVALTNSLSKKHHISIRPFGAAMVASANAQQSKDDIVLTVSITVTLLLIGLSFFFRDIFIVFKLFVPVVLGASITLALLSFRNEPISIISVAIGSAILGMSIDFSLHLVSHWKGKENAKNIFRDIAMPIMMSSGTTTFAFLGLLFMNSPALTDLGIFAGCSVVIASLSSLIVLPHILKSKTNQFEIKSDKLNKYIKPIRWVSFVVIVLSFFTYQDVKFEDDLMKINYMPDWLAENEAHIQELSKASKRSSFIFYEGKDINEALKSFEKDQVLYKQINEDTIVEYATQFSLLLQSKEYQKDRIAKWKNYWSVDKKNTLDSLLVSQGQQFGFSEKAFKNLWKSVEEEPSLSSIENQQFLCNNVFKGNVFANEDQVYLMSIVKHDLDKIDLLASHFENASGTVFNKQVMTSKVIQVLSEDFTVIVNYSLLVVFLILLLSYGRIELAIITFLPILLGWIVTLGIMGFFDLRFNVVNIILTSLIFGLGIDYSIFYVRGFLNRYHYGKDEISTYRQSILLSSGTTLVGVGVLILAKHPAMFSVGVLSVVGIFSVTLITLVLIPILFNFLIDGRNSRKQVPNTAFTVFWALVTGILYIVNVMMLSVLALPLLIKKNRNTKYDELFHYLLMKINYWVLKCSRQATIHYNIDPEEFKKPALIIANHQSSMDIVTLIASHPKLIIATTDWVWNNKVFGFIVRCSDYFNVKHGYETYRERVEKKIENGYSILIFPEGTRNDDARKLRRFHKGAFLMAEEFKLDIVPFVLTGLDVCLPKGSIFTLSGKAVIKNSKRILYSDRSWGNTYQERSKSISKFMRDEYKIARELYYDNEYRRRTINANFIYKGPVLEWYQKIKCSLEKNYRFFDGVLPRKGKIVDIGCGYGFLSLNLGMASEDREIIGIDYDEEKIETAKHCVSKPDNVSFITGDATQLELEDVDAFVMLDILHYLPKEMQTTVVTNCMKMLKSGGRLVIRDANNESKDKQKGTWLTEFLSTNLGFNKAVHKLEFIGKSDLIEMLSGFEYKIRTVKSSKVLSNLVYIIDKV